MDVKETFVNGVIEEEVYIEQTPSFETHDKKTHVCRINKVLYLLKKEPRECYRIIDEFLMSLGFHKSKAHSNLYYHVEDVGIMIFTIVCRLSIFDKENLINGCKKNLTT